MKKLSIFLLLIVSAAIISCKKSENKLFTPSANLLVANAVVGGGPLTFGGTTLTVGLNNSASFPLLAGQSQVMLVNNTITPAATYYSQTVSANNGGNYSLFLAGPSPDQVDAVLITENYKNYTDSLCGVRFINLSPGSSPISVSISGQADGSEVQSLAYKAYSDFKQYPAKRANATYAFQIKDAVAGNIIANYTLRTPYFHNVTVVLRGTVGSAGVTLVTHP